MPLVDRDESVLVVVDTQPGFFAREEPHAAHARAAVRNAIWLATIATLLEIPAIVTEEAPGEEGATEPRVLECLAPGVPVFTKPSFGVAGCPEIVEAILATKRSTAVLVGFETDVCVAQSAIGLKDMGLRTVVVADATFTQDSVQHEFGLARMRQLSVELVSAKGLAYEWMRTVELANEMRASAQKMGRTPHVAPRAGA